MYGRSLLLPRIFAPKAAPVKPSLSDILYHLGESREEPNYPVSPPIQPTTNFGFPTLQPMREGLQQEYDQPFYTRGVNPTVKMLREKVAALEGAEDALVFSSGSAAVAAAVLHTVQAGDHVVCVQKPYSWTNHLLLEYLPRFGITTTFVDGTEVENFRQALQENTRLIFLESPNSVTFELQDIRAVAALAQEHGITTIIDNSYSTPLLQRPLEMGVDLIVHSATKYYGGHSDVVAGVVCGSHQHIRQMLEEEYMTLGAIAQPQEAWLLLRGLRTLHIRLERAASTAMQVVDFLHNHPKVERVLYPFHPSHPQYELAQRQMKSGAGQFSILLKAADMDAVARFCDSLKFFLLAASWGGYESLCFPTAALLGTGEEETDLPFNLIRFYVGLEEPEELIADLEHALEQV